MVFSKINKKIWSRLNSKINKKYPTGFPQSHKSLTFFQILVLHQVFGVIHSVVEVGVFLHGFFEAAVAHRLCFQGVHATFFGTFHTTLIKQIAGIAVPCVFAGKKKECKEKKEEK
jgi:hypothetical protein